MKRWLGLAAVLVGLSGPASAQFDPSAASVPIKILSAASTNSTLVKGRAGGIVHIVAINTTATIYYLKLYDKATAPTCGTDTPVQTFPIPANATGAGFVLTASPNNIGFLNGIGLCLTGGSADNDTTVAATGVVISLGYK